jgi:hypothetical protein
VFSPGPWAECADSSDARILRPTDARGSYHCGRRHS